MGVTEKTMERIYEEIRRKERKRIIRIIKSHIEPTYPINCKSIIDEINDTVHAKDGGGGK